MELDQNSDSGNLDPGYDLVSPIAIPDQEDTRYFPEEQTGLDLPFGCQWRGDTLSEFYPGTQAPKLDSDATAVYQGGGIKPDKTTLLRPKENVYRGESGVSLVAWEEVLRPMSNPEDQMEDYLQVEQLQNTTGRVLEHVREGFSLWKNAENFRIPTCYSPNAFLDAESDQTSEYNESLEPNFVGMNEEKQKLATPVLDSFYDVTESGGKASPDFDFEEISNTGDEFRKGKVALQGAVENTTTVLERHMVGLKAPDSMDNICTEKVGYRGYLEKAGEDGTGEPVSKKNSKKKKKKTKGQKILPNRFDTMNSHPVTYSSASYVKPGSETSYTRGIIRVSEHVFSKEICPANENSNARGVKPSSEHSFAKGFHSTYENSCARGAKPSREYSSAKGFHPTSEHSFAKGFHPTNVTSYARGVRPTGEHSFAKGFHPTSEYSYGRGVRPTSEHSFAKGFHPTSENFYARGVRPTGEHSFAKGFHPTSEYSYGRGVRPTSEHSFAKGFHPTSEYSYGRGVSPTNDHSFAKGFHPTNENSYARGVRPASEHSFAKGFHPRSENSHSRDFKPSGEHSFPKGAHQVCETSCTRVFRPTSDNSYAMGFRPASETLCVKGSQSTSFNLSRERKVAFSEIMIAKREERTTYLNTARETKNIGTHYCSSPTPILMSRPSSSDMPKPCDPVPTSYPAGSRKVAVVKPRPKEMEVFSRKLHGPQTECDFVEMLLATDNMFEERSPGKKTRPGYEKHADGFLGGGGTSFQRGVSKEWPRKGRGEGSTERGFRGGGQQWTQSQPEQHPEYSRGLVGPEEPEEMEPPLQLKYVNWVGKEDIGHFFVSGMTTVDTARNEESGCHSQLNFLTFDDLVLLDGLETAVVSITDSIETVVAKGFVARFPGSCSLHLLVNEDNRIYPEYIIVCCSCPKLIIAHQVGAVKSCPKCRFVRLGTYPEMKIKCQFMLLRSAQMLRFVLLSSSLSICEWEERIQYGWFHDFSAVNEAKSNSDQQYAPFWKDLAEFLASLQISDLNVFSGIDFFNVSPAVRLIHTKPGVSCTNDPSKYGAPQLQQIIKNLVWKSPKKKQSLYKTERLGQRCYSILNDVFPSALSGDFQTSVKHVKVVYPSVRWVNECVATSESPERVKLLPTVRDIHSFGDLPWNFLNDLCVNKDFVHNYNVLVQYENWEEAGKKRKYGWCLTGSQALDTESWGDDYPVYHKVMYKHFQLSVGLFPYLRRNAISKEVEVCAVDLCDIPLPFDPLAVVHYRHDDMPRLVLDTGQNVFCHCVGIFTRAKGNFGFIRQSPLLKGFLDPFPAPQPGQYRHDVFLHVSSLSQLELPQEGSVIEFFFLNQPPTTSQDFIKVCSIYVSVKEAKKHFLSTMPSVAVDEELVHKEMVKAKALSLGLEWIDDVKRMEDAIEDHYNVFFSSQRRGFSYFPTQAQIDAISMEPTKILSDADWVRDYYKNRQNRGGLPKDVGPCRPKVLLATFQAMKYRFVKELREVEELNKKLEEENQRYIQNRDT